ncbi:MAG TPA: hypothetical protein VFE32_07955 [Puia sp.]|jgi:hypothetical protein|nr:hypothetical protein [Puia sp.]
MALGLGALYGRLLTGEKVIRDFVTVAAGDQLREKVYLVADGREWDVTGNQWLLGLDPRVMGIWVGKADGGEGGKGMGGGVAEDLGGRLSYNLYVKEGEEAPKALGVMKLEYADRMIEDNGTLFLFRVQSTVIHHIEPWRAWLLYQKFYKKPGVTYERLKAVAAAYTYPRRVRIISFRFDDNNNYIFPMDLLADIRTAGRYLLGMRHSNQVLKRIMEAGQIVVAEAPAEYKDLIYRLGRNHSASPPPRDQLPFGLVATRKWGYYLPDWVESYKEIRIGRTQDLGSHMLLCGEWDEDVVLKPATPRLHHIHFLYYLHQKMGGGHQNSGKAISGQ